MCFFSFAVVALLPCGANGDSMCVMSEDGLSQHPKVASKTQLPPLTEITEHTLTVEMDLSVYISSIDNKILTPPGLVLRLQRGNFTSRLQ